METVEMLARSVIIFGKNSISASISLFFVAIKQYKFKCCGGAAGAVANNGGHGSEERSKRRLQGAGCVCEGGSTQNCMPTACTCLPTATPGSSIQLQNLVQVWTFGLVSGWSAPVQVTRCQAEAVASSHRPHMLVPKGGSMEC